MKQSKIKALLDFDIGSVSLTQLSQFVKMLSIMLRSGIPIVDALEISGESTSGKLHRILQKIIKALQAGHSLSEAMEQYPRIFPTLLVSTIQVGESSGTLDENLDHIAVQLEKERDLRSKVTSALLYPGIITVAACALGVFMVAFVLPKIVPLFQTLQTELPLSTRVLIGISDFFQNYKEVLGVALVVTILLGGWLVKQKFVFPVTHWLILNIPILSGVTKKSNIARFCRTLGVLLRSGVGIDEALKITRNSMGNFYYEKALDNARARIVKGTKLSANLTEYKRYFPKLVLSMVRSGEESGKLDETLLYLADYYDKEVDVAAKNLSTMLEPILLLVMGLSVAFLALAVITPIFELTGNIRR